MPNNKNRFISGEYWINTNDREVGQAWLSRDLAQITGMGSNSRILHLTVTNLGEPVGPMQSTADAEAYQVMK
jgi:hypothetical protein